MRRVYGALLVAMLVVCRVCADSGVCENRDGWLVAWGLCGSMLIRFSTVWLLPFTLLLLLAHTERFVGLLCLLRARVSRWSML